jgi:hypothetical protein
MKKTLTLNKFLKEFFPFLKQHGMEEDNIRSYFDTWKASHPVGSVNDFAWMIFNTILHEIPKQIPTSHPHFYKFQADTYFNMALFQRRFENKSGNHVWSDMLRCKVHEQTNNFHFLLCYEIVGDSQCSHSMQYDGKKYGYSEILEELRVFNKNCSREKGCICMVCAIGVRNKNGSLISR